MKMEEVIALVLAAGKGTRMKSKLPKVLHKAGGVPMVGQVLRAVKDAGTKREIVVVGFGAEAVTAYVGETAETVVQKEQLGTGHAVLQAESLLQGEKGILLVTCGDTPLVRTETFRALLDCHKKTQASATVLTACMPDPTGYGRVIRSADGKVSKIVEQKDGTSQELAVNEVNAGIYCFELPELWELLHRIGNNNAQGEYYLTDIIGMLVADGKTVSAVAAEDYRETLGVNSRLQLAQAEKILRERKLEELMTEGVTVQDPSNTYVETTVTVGRDTVLYAGTVLEGRTVIGDKNSHIGEGTKLPHLSYIGDSDVGAGVNIGCGTITVNYDGKVKHRTTIGNHAFVGCNSNLVAPVEIGESAYVGAGSTITKNVPPKSLAVGRAKQRNIENWVNDDTYKK